MFLSLQNDSYTILSYFEHLGAHEEAPKISWYSKNRCFLVLRSVWPSGAPTCDMNIIFLISDRYDVKYVEISWYNMEGRMAGRWISVDSRQSEVFIQKIEFSTSRYIIMCIAPPHPPLHEISYTILRYRIQILTVEEFEFCFSFIHYITYSYFILRIWDSRNG